MKRTPDRAWSMPWDAPLVPEFPFTFRSVEVMTLVYRTRADAIRALLPPPLEPTGEHVLIHIYNMHDVDWLGSYGECNVMVGASLKGRATGGYSTYLFLDSDVGKARIEVRKDLLVGSLRRNRINVITGTMGYKQQTGSLDDLKSTTFDFSVNLNYKVIPNIDGTDGIRQITSRKLSDVKVHECWTGPCTVELRPNVQAPVYRLPVVEMMDGYFWRADFTLVRGEIIHTYRP
jgi:acetoacetate decarboxylase